MWKRKRTRLGGGSIRCLTVTLSILLTIPTIFAAPLTRAEVDSAIDSEELFPGSEVREFLYTMIEETDKALEETAEEAAATAARPLLVDIAGRDATIEVLEDQLEARPWILIGSGIAVLSLGGVIGYMIGGILEAVRFGDRLSAILEKL